MLLLLFTPSTGGGIEPPPPAAGGRQAWRAPQRLPSPEPPEDQNDLAILLLLT
jgi:hypothetical protein